MILKYTSDGSIHINGVPARDLDKDDIDKVSRDFSLEYDYAIEELVKTGIYKEAITTSKKRKAQEISIKDIPDDTTDKPMTKANTEIEGE